MKSNPAKKNRTRQATAAVLALALGAAVYLNWSFARAAPQDLTVGAIADGTAQEVSTVIDPLTDDTAVETAAAVDTTDTQAPTGKNYGEAQMVSVSKDSGAEFFESARLARTKARDEALDTLKKSLKDAKLSDAEKKKLTEDLAAEQKARVTYDNILRLSDDPDVNDVIKFLRQREIVHFQRFGEAAQLLREKLDQRNIYATNPAFDL